MSKKILLITFFSLLFTDILALDFKLKDQPSEEIIVVKPIKKSRRERRLERQKVEKKETKSTGLIAKSTREQTIDELKHNLEIYLKYNNTDLSIKYLEVLIAKLTDFVEIRDTRLQLADLYFKSERYDKAGSVYLEYYEAYPGYMSAEYALYQAILSKYKQVRSCDRDNSITLEVLELSKQYLQNKSYLKYQKEILDMLQVCSNQVLEAEIYVFEHYFKNGYLKAAQRRLDYIVEKILPKQAQAKKKIDDLQDLLNKAKTGKNPLKLLKSYHRAANVNKA